MAATLGCGTYDVFLQARGGGGGDILSIIPWSSIEWARLLDDTSEASVGLDLANPDCCELLSVARPWQHEVSIRRDGAEVWVGPLYTLVQPPEQNQLTARDLTAWWDRRLIHNDHTYTDTDMAVIFENVSSDAMAPDNSPGLTVSASPCGITATQKYLAAQHLFAGATLRDLANIGIDWTAVGRNVLVGGTTVPVAPIGTLTDGHFQAPPQPTLDGSAQRNVVVVRGDGGGEAGDTIYGVSSPDPFYTRRDGLLEDVVSVSTIRDNVSAKAAADTRAALQQEVAVISDSVLAASAPVTIDQLIAGAIVDLRLSTCIPVAGNYRLQKVGGKIQASDNLEQITLSVQPVGTT